MAKERGLNDRQRRFAELVVAGEPATVAYGKAGYSTKGRNAEGNASALMENHGVKAYLKELRKPQKVAAVATRQRKREILLAIMEGKRKDATVADMIRAIQADNLMTGDNKPMKIEGEITLKRILEAIDESPMSRDDD